MFFVLYVNKDVTKKKLSWLFYKPNWIFWPFHLKSYLSLSFLMKFQLVISSLSASRRIAHEVRETVTSITSITFI